MENKILIKNLFGDWKECSKEEAHEHIKKWSDMGNIESEEKMLHYLKTLFVRGISDEELIKYIRKEVD